MNQPPPEDRQAQPLGKGMLIAAWVLFLLLMAMAFQKWLDKKTNPNQDVVSYIGTGGAREVVLQRNTYGHYVTTGTINGTRVEFLVDTGATDVALSAKLADRLGLHYGYAGQSITAAGTVTSYHTLLDSVAVGELRINNIEASIVPKMDDHMVLLGMSYLKHLELIQKGDKLTIRQTP